MPRITAGVPVMVTVDGLKEQLDRLVDTETRLYWEQQLDRGDAILTPLSEVYPEGHWSRLGLTHRLTSETGGVFHVTVEDARPREWPRISLPDNLGLLVEMTRELDRMTRQLQTLMVANAELEALVRDLQNDR
jgi:hypothetical protein